MLEKQNCWEYHNCGRETGGYEAGRYGVCSASISSECDGLNDGTYGGRICWATAGTFASGNVTGKYACEKFSCINCDFFKIVSDEQGENNFEMVTPAQKMNYKQNKEKLRVKFVEKRSSDRFPSSLSANFSCCDRDYTGTITNISETGLFISTKDMCFPNDSSFKVSIDTGNAHLNVPVRMCRLTISPDFSDGIGVEVINTPQNYLIHIGKLRTTALI